MRKLFKVIIGLMVIALILAGCATAPKIFTFSIADQEAAVGRNLVLDLSSFVVNTFPGSLSFVLDDGPGSITESTYTYSSDIGDVGSHEVTIIVTNSTGSELECVFNIDTQIVVAGALTLDGTPVTTFNPTVPELKVHVDNVLYSNYTFNYSTSTGEYEIRGLPQGVIKVWFDFDTPEAHAATLVPECLPGGIKYTGSIDLNTVPIADFTDYNLGSSSATYMMHVTTPQDNAVVNDPTAPYPIYYSPYVTFTWDPVPDADHYFIKFYGPEGAMFGSNTGSNTTYTNNSNFPLSPLVDPNEYYWVEIQARDSSNITIGMVNTVYTNGYITNIRFRIEPI